MCVSKATKKSQIREMQLPPRIITRKIFKNGWCCLQIRVNVLFMDRNLNSVKQYCKDYA